MNNGKHVYFERENKFVDWLEPGRKYIYNLTSKVITLKGRRIIQCMILKGVGKYYKWLNIFIFWLNSRATRFEIWFSSRKSLTFWQSKLFKQNQIHPTSFVIAESVITHKVVQSHIILRFQNSRFQSKNNSWIFKKGILLSYDFITICKKNFSH